MAEEMKYGEDDEKCWAATYKYDLYDANGNWLQRTKYLGDKIAGITKREIKYYK